VSKHILLVFIALLISSELTARRAAASEVVSVDPVDTAEIYHSDDPDKRIPGLVWDETPLVIDRETAGERTQYFTEVRGRFTQGYRAVRYRIETGALVDLPVADSQFKFRVPLTSSKLRIQFYVDRDARTHYTEIIYIRSHLGELSHHWSFDVGLSYSLIDYRETYVNTFKLAELGVTPQAGVTYRLSPKFELNLNGYFTAAAIDLKKSPDDIENSRFYGVNGRVGYRLREFSKQARLYLMPGWYLWGQIVPGALDNRSYGVSALSGPQAFLMGRFTTQSNHQWYAYLKAAMIQDGSWNGGNHELSLGGGYQISDPFQSRRWMLTFDLSQANYSANKDGDEEHFEMLTASIGIGTNL